MSSALLALFTSTQLLLVDDLSYLGMLSILALTACLILDRIDGPLARKWGTSSPMGAQLDSFADLLAFAVMPSLFLVRAFGGSAQFDSLFILSCLAYNATAIWRLARFNVASNDHDANYFTGIPTPVAGGALLASYTVQQILNWPIWSLCVLQIIIAGFMVSRLPYPKRGWGLYPWLILCPLMLIISIMRYLQTH